jgi:hypothetical protein
MLQLISDNTNDVSNFDTQVQILETFASYFEARVRAGAFDTNDSTRAATLLKVVAEQQRKLLESV